MISYWGSVVSKLRDECKEVSRWSTVELMKPRLQTGADVHASNALFIRDLSTHTRGVFVIHSSDLQYVRAGLLQTMVWII